MSVAAKVLKFSAQITTEKGRLDIPVSSVRFVHAINELPVVLVESVMTNETVKELGVSMDTFSGLGATMQSYLINKFRRYPDIYVAAEDGSGNRIDFNGFITNPALELRTDRFVITYTAMHKSLAIQSYNTNIYEFPKFHGDTQAPIPTEQPGDSVQDIESQIMKKLSHDSDSIGDRIDAILQSLSENYDQITATAYTGKINLSPLHAINQNVYKNYIAPMLSKSYQRTIIPLTGIKTRTGSNSGSEHITARLTASIVDTLYGSDNFLVALGGICEMFKFQLNATWNDTAWMEHGMTHQETEGRFITAPVSSIRLNIGTSYELPLLKVFVHVPNGDMHGFTNSVERTSPTWSVGSSKETAELIRTLPKATIAEGGMDSCNFVSYPQFNPAPTEMGVFLVIAPPKWVAPGLTLASRTGSKIGEENNSLIDSLNGVYARHTDAGRFAAQQYNLLIWAAEREFSENFLRHASASVALPFCVNVQVGRTYEVREVGTDKPIFSGFLASVGHELTQSDGGNLIANTTLMFTHVKMAGVDFHRLQDVPTALPENYELPAATLKAADLKAAIDADGEKIAKALAFAKGTYQPVEPKVNTH